MVFFLDHILKDALWVRTGETLENIELGELMSYEEIKYAKYVQAEKEEMRTI